MFRAHIHEMRILRPAPGIYLLFALLMIFTPTSGAVLARNKEPRVGSVHFSYSLLAPHMLMLAPYK